MANGNHEPKRQPDHSSPARPDKPKKRDPEPGTAGGGGGGGPKTPL